MPKVDEKKRDTAIEALNKLELLHGRDVFRNACNRKLNLDRQTRNRLSEIRRLEKELIRLKDGKLCQS